MKKKSIEAQNLDTTVQDKMYNLVRTIAVELGNSAIVKAKERVAAENARAKRLSRTFIGISILVFVLSWYRLYLSRIIANPLR